MLTPLVEVTLVWVLFSDAARLPVRELRLDGGRYLRLLGVGLPLTILFGTCGSGKKWKRCHGEARASASSPQG